MISNLIIRQAKDISRANEIANFSARYGVNYNGISAVSWENPHSSRRESGAFLLRELVRKINPACLNIQVMVELSAEQPDNVIVNYKKTWGLLKDDGINVDEITDKVNFERRGKVGLILSATGSICIFKDDVVSGLINNIDKLYFAIGDNVSKCSSVSNSEDWMKCVWDNDGVIFMLLGYFDEPTCEVVAMGNASTLLSAETL